MARSASSAKTNPDYRPDIDGLRAFAILPVLLYHAGLSSFSGGFVGVDVFFVISGYLISKIIYAEVETSAFSVKAFYGRRARRLLPAFFVVSALTLAASLIVLFPEQLSLFARSLLWSTLFAGNIFFWRQDNYFAPEAETHPLLNYWSLGVEEQFYFVFPWLAILCLRFMRGALLPVLVVVALASLIASQWMLSVSPETAFYLLPFRAWEMLLGCILAVRGFPRPPNATIGGALALLGVGVILAVSLTYSSAMSFPGFAALAPVLGAALVIWGGETRNAVSDHIGMLPFGYIGRISYSLYLVHWPVAFFAQRLFPDAASAWLVVGIVGLSLALAAAIYHLVEVPTRTGVYWTPPRIVTLAKTGFAATILIASSVTLSAGFPGRFSPEAQKLFAFAYDYRAAYREGVCFLRTEQSFSDLDQAKCLPTGARTALLWGDSHAAHFVVALQPQLERNGYTFAQATSLACRPIVGLVIADRPHCREFNDKVLAWVKQHRPQEIILSASWSDSDKELADLEREVVELKKLGSNVTVIGRSPQFTRNALDQVKGQVAAGQTTQPSIGKVPDWIVAAERKMAARLGKVTRYVPIMDLSCPGGQCQLADKNFYPYYLDTAHRSDVGARAAVELMAKYLPGETASQ